MADDRNKASRQCGSDTVLVAVTAGVTVGLRALPFVLFGSGKKCPAAVTYIGRVLSPAAIAMLVVYCFCSAYRDRAFLASGAGVPELAAGLVTVALQRWKRNPLLSILVGTAVYMVLIQLVF